MDPRGGMKKPFQFSTLLFYALVRIMVAISVSSFVAALSWLNKPFAGFLVYDPPSYAKRRL